MPKIKRNTIVIRLEKTVERITVDLQYNNQMFFYEIPDKYNKYIDGMSETRKKELFINITHKTKYGVFRAYVVRSTSEKDCEEKYIACITELMNTSLERKNVIIVYFNNQSYTGGYKNDNRLDYIGLKYSIEYAVEITVNNNKSYQLETICPPSTFRKEESMSYEIVDISYKRCVIIEDTLENRKKVEQLYSALELLIRKIESVTTDYDSLINLINSDTKLLN